MSPELHPDTQSFLEKPHKMLLDGHWTGSSAGTRMESLNPATEKPLAEFQVADSADVDQAVAAARRAFESGPWPAMGPAEREQLLCRLADAIEAHTAVLTELEILDVGMPLNPAARL